MNVKRIPMDGPKNFRDLGGYINKEGKLIGFHKLYRADGLSELTASDIEKLRIMGIKTIVDLRSKTEQAMAPDIVPEGVTYRSCPMMNEEIKVSDKEQDVGAFKKSLITGYITMIDEAPGLIARAVTAVIQGLGEGGVVFHCTAGKDRTGILAAVLLTLLDAYEEDIIADYEVTHTYNEKGINAKVKKLAELNHVEHKVIDDAMLSSHPETIKAVLDKLGSFSVSEWLMKNGVEKVELEQLKSQVLEI